MYGAFRRFCMVQIVCSAGGVGFVGRTRPPPTTLGRTVVMHLVETESNRITSQRFL